MNNAFKNSKAHCPQFLCFPTNNTYTLFLPGGSLLRRDDSSAEQLKQYDEHFVHSSTTASAASY
jgi:hypothetical protein